jgi:two-component system, NtrC family, C4-dicarboxylate transport sensor histidine kinase DctB
MSQRFARWVRTQSGPHKEAAGVDTWLALAGIGLAIIAVGAWLPPTAPYFRGPAKLWLLCLAPGIVFSIIAASLVQRNRLSPRAYGIVLLISACGSQFFAAALVAASEPPGAWIMAALFLLTVTYQAYLHKVSVDFPYGAFATLAATSAAMPLVASRESLTALGVAFGMGLPLAFILGTFGLRGYSAELQQQAMRDALHARALRDASEEREQVLGRLQELLRTNHDCRNNLSTVFVNAQLLRECTQKQHIDEHDVSEMYRMVDVLTRGLGRLKTLLDSNIQFSAGIPKLEPVLLEDLVPEVIQEVRSRYPGVCVECPQLGEGRQSWVPVTGGRLTLHRVLHNVILNACEGNGSERASAIHLRWSLIDGGSGAVLECIDDGPGFAAEQLEVGAPRPFMSTKASGTGVGLYTVWNLLRASGGSLERANRPGRGAIVTMRIGHAAD